MNATAHTTIRGGTITVTVQGRGLDLETDAQRAADAVAAHLGSLPSDLADQRARFAPAANGDTDECADDLSYGLLIARVQPIAYAAVVEGWAHPDAFVTVDLNP